MSDFDDLEEQAENELLRIMETAANQDAKLAAKKAFDEIQRRHIREDIAVLEAGTHALLRRIDDLTVVIEKMGPVGNSGATLKALRDSLADAYGAFRSDKGLPNSSLSDAEAAQPAADESAEEPSQNPKPIAQAQGQPLANPRPIDSRDYAALSDEYIRFFIGAAFNNQQVREQVGRLAAVAVANKNRYNTVGDALGHIPWWFIAGIHMLESSFNFDTHLHNGDPLVRRTVRVPSGRPIADPAAGPGRRHTWEESAIDALRMKKFETQMDWSVSRALFRWETYNGFGYRSRRVPTPYLWSFSSIYRSGKFVADHVFSEVAVSRQCGAAVFLKFLSDTGQADLKLDFVDEPEAPMAPAFDHAAASAASNNQPTVDGPRPVNAPFDQFVGDAIATGKLPPLRHFRPGDFFVKGGANAATGLNTDPPRELWPNVLALMKVVDEFRERIGHPVVLNSVYRSEAYNTSVGGVSGSQHKKFQAADIRVVGSGNPQQWAQQLKALRAANVFRGGIGVYNTFVHVDTRGWDANW